MTPSTHPNPDIFYPLPPPSVHDSQLLHSSADQDFSDPSISLSFVDGQSSFDQAASVFIASNQSATTSAGPIDDYGLSPFSVLTPRQTTDSLDQAKLLAGHSSSQSDLCNGPKLPKADPWTSVAVTGQPVTAKSHQQQLTVANRPYKPPHTDSGYEGSLLSAPLMPVSRPARKGQTNFQDEAMREEMQHVLVDQQLPSPMAITSLPSAKPRSGSTSTARPESLDGLHCSICEIAFSTSSEHLKHMARHEKKHKCTHPDCTRHAGFATSNDLDRHKRGVHGDIGLEDPVWRCFVEGCKTPGKTWPRQDNFRAHIERMHKHVDVAEYVAISDRWFEEEEKPRRQEKLASLATNQNQSHDLPIGQFQQYSGAMTEQNYPASHADPSDYARSVAGEFPDSRQPPAWEVGAGSSLSQQFSTLYSPSFPTPALIPYTSMDESARGYSTNPMVSFSSMTHSGQQNDPPLPFAHRENDFMDSFRNANVDVGFSNIVKPLKARTLPDQERMNNSFFPDWQTSNYDVSSPMMDLPTTNSHNELAFMGGENNTPILSFPEGDVLSSDTPSSVDPHMANPTPTAEQITEKNNRELQHEVAQLMAKCSDPRLAQKLKDSIAKTIKDHATSTTVNVGTTSAQGNTEASLDQAAPYQCSRDGCYKTFAMKNRLTKHEKRHDRIFFCTFDLCYKRFGTKTDLSRHEFRVHKQSKAWRCWANNRTRDKNKQCAILFYDEHQFEAHRKEDHSRIQWPLDAFRIDKDFSGAFWCGFCNAVVQNPIGVDVDGLKRVQFRYQHIENHMNDIYHRLPGHDAMQDWHELDGQGKTKAAMKDSGKNSEEHTHEDEDSDDDDDAEGSSPRAVPVLSSGSRPRALTESKPKRHGQYLQVPSVSQPRKRGAEFATPNVPASQMFKVRKVQPPRSVAGGFSLPRHASVSGASGTATGSFQPQPSLASDSSPNNSIVAYIKCCRCTSPPRVNEGYRTCNNCFEPNCEKCLYFGVDKQRLQVTLDGTVRSIN